MSERVVQVGQSVADFFAILLFAIGACLESDGQEELAKELLAINELLETTAQRKRLAKNAVLKALGGVSKRRVKMYKAVRALHKSEEAYIADAEPKKYTSLFEMTPAAMEKLKEEDRAKKYGELFDKLKHKVPAPMESAAKKARAAIEKWTSVSAALVEKEKAAALATKAEEDAKEQAITALAKFDGELRTVYPSDKEEQDSFYKPASRKPKAKDDSAEGEATAEAKNGRKKKGKGAADAQVPQKPGPVASGTAATPTVTVDLKPGAAAPAGAEATPSSTDVRK